MSNMKNGFSTLNRWLGKKNKDKATPNGKLSKSQTNLNLSVSSTNINETSQLEYNRITPLPVVTSNAPFEQTFRITVLLPKDQLYVARLGARVPLSKLLELVCENKQLESEKYEFRNPVDPSQIYSCDLTIGAVGLSEVRLCHKSEAYDNFNADEVIKLHRTSIIRDSLSSSEFSSRNSKHTTKTASPYSSSNSLNSMDSTGMNYARTPVGPPPAMPANTAPKMMAPPRKKRAAPRPPSQTAIPERSALIITNNNTNNNNNVGHETSKVESNGKPMTPNGVALNEAMPKRKDFYVSAPNLASSTMLSQSSFSIDCNGNSKTNPNYNDNDDDESVVEDTVDHHNGTQVEQKNARNLYRGSVQNLSSNLEAAAQKFPEPSPRKRILQIKKKAAPAPPPRSSAYFDDSFSVHSNTPETPTTPGNTPEIFAAPETSAAAETPATPQTPASSLTTSFPQPSDGLSQTTLNESSDIQPPKPLARETSLKSAEVATVEVATKALPASAAEPPANVPKPVPRITTTTIVNATAAYDSDSATSNNVSKVMLNRTPTPEPRSLSTEPPLSDINAEVTSLAEDAHLLNGHHNAEDDDNVSKQADSGIGEPIPSPIPDSLPSEGSNIDGKLSTFESSSDDDDMVKVYNFKLGKTLFQPLDEQQAIPEDMSLVHDLEPERVEHDSTKFSTETTSIVSETAFWSFQIPISPPPNFADSAKSNELFETESSDAPITPNIKERPVLDFGKISADVKKPASSETESSTVKLSTTPLPSPQNASMNSIVDELSAIISEQRMGTIIKRAEEAVEIEAAKPNTLSNFSIASIAQQPAKPTEPENTNVNTPSSPESATDEEKLYRKRGSLTQSTTILKQRRSITRADSFHTTMQQSTKSTLYHSVTDAPEQGLGSRSTSQLSLTKIEQNGLNLQRRRSSSELSIGESPSLQSLEIIKTILNSRKNSLNNSGSDGESKSVNGEFLNSVEQPAIVTETISKISPEPQRKVSETFVKLTDPVDKPPKELPKVYRYSGPPSINFSTWSERPKVQVAIKNEGDYIFGGKNASSQNAAVTTAVMDLSNSVPSRAYRASTPAEDFRDFKFRNQKKPLQSEELKKVQSEVLEVEPPKPLTTTMRMGIPEKEYKIPITVKPLEDFAIESVELRMTNDKTKPAQTSKHAVSTATLNMNGNINARQNGRVFETATSRPYTQYGNNTTLPRNGGNARFSMPAPGQTLLRSTSITQLEANKPKLSAVEIEIAAPFGQNTLRKTGFKEKMLAQESAEQVKNSTETAVNAQTAQNSTIKLSNYQQQHITQQTHSAQKSPSKTLQSAKLELKLQKSTSVYVNQASSPVVTSSQVMPKSAPIATTTTTPPPPPPPAPASLKSTTKRAQFNIAVTPTADPRDQLLEAIRNFKREELNRS